MYLIDTNVLSEARKGNKANSGVIKFFNDCSTSETLLFLSSITIGELRRGVEVIRNRGDVKQSELLEKWLEQVVIVYSNFVLTFDQTEAQVWGQLRVPNSANAIDKQIAATALVNDLTLVTRNIKDFKETGVALLNPFS